MPKRAQPVTRPAPTSQGPNLIPRAKILLFRRPTSPAKRHGHHHSNASFTQLPIRKRQRKIWNQGHNGQFPRHESVQNDVTKKDQVSFLLQKKKKESKKWPSAFGYTRRRANLSQWQVGHPRGLTARHWTGKRSGRYKRSIRFGTRRCVTSGARAWHGDDGTCV